ncbi:MAG: RsiW-degrading membrane proteinase PrsW (M82 family) [Pirellulaceae bacterium]|jgi:RsiW-degrading membrane proteinase PrsW (M82 family)
MVDWYWSREDTQVGPCDLAEIRRLVGEGSIVADTFLWKEGVDDWFLASTVEDLFPQKQSSPPLSPSPPPPPLPVGEESKASKALENAKQHATALIRDLQSMSFREDLVPVDEGIFRRMFGDFVFWAATLLGVVPLLIGTLSSNDHQLTAFALFFAILWGVLFKYFIIRSKIGWGLLLSAMFATGIVGIFVLLTIYSYILPAWYVNLPASENVIIRLVGFIVQVGFCEEICKAVPVLAYLIWKRKSADPLTAVSIGIFSGLGFAAFENMIYSQRSIQASYALTREYGASGLAAGVQAAMVTAMLRSLSLVFCHAVWAGIFAYFLAVANLTGRRWAALTIVGLSIASILHGTYDWLAGIQPTFAALVVVVSFVLFYAYTSRLRLLSENANEAKTVTP